MATERKLFFLRLTESTANQYGPLGELEKLLNSGWNISQAIPLAGAGGMAAVQVLSGGSPEAAQFAEWASLVVLEKAERK